MFERAKIEILIDQPLQGVSVHSSVLIHSESQTSLTNLRRIYLISSIFLDTKASRQSTSFLSRILYRT